MEPISFELNGFPKTLRNENACRKAVEKKQIKPETPVLSYDNGGARQRILAKDHPVLRELLGIEELEEEEVEEEAIEEQEPDDKLEASWVKTPTAPATPEHVANDLQDNETVYQDAGAVAAANRTISEPVNVPDPEPEPEPVIYDTAPAAEEQTKSKLGWLAPGLGFGMLLLYSFNSRDDADDFATDGVAQEGEAAAYEDSADDPSLDQSYNGDFGAIRATQILSAPGSSRLKSLRPGEKFFVRGTRQRYAYGYDESNIYGYVAWRDINANPFDNRTYQFTFGNSTRETVYLLLTFKVGDDWKQQKIVIRPNEYNRILRLDGRVAPVSSLEGYYYRVKSSDRWNRLRASSTRTVYDPGAGNSDTKMTMIVPRVENSQAYIEF